jgi:hypothetical protein
MAITCAEEKAVTERLEARQDTVIRGLGANSPKQLKDLWVKFTARLGIEPTDMERQVLETPAAE